MEAWSEIGREKRLQAKQCLWRQDDAAGIGAFLVEGVLGVEKLSEGGDRVVFTELNPGAVLGEMSCLDGQAHSATVKALTPSTVRVFTAQEFEVFLKEDPERLKQLLLRQNERLRSLTEKLLLVGTQSVLRRLSYWLCEQSTESLSITHQDLAATLATTRESVSKAVASLRKLGLITSRRGKIEIPDKVALAASLERV